MMDGGGLDINSYNGQYKTIDGDYGIQQIYTNTNVEGALPVTFEQESYSTSDLTPAQPYGTQPYMHGGGNGYYQSPLQQALNQEFGTTHLTPVQTSDPNYGIPLLGKLEQDGDSDQKKKVHPAGPHICDICNKEFSSFPSLKRHRDVHTGQKKFVCNLCGNCYTQKHNLTKHMRLHTGEKPFKCNMCDKAFYVHHHLKNHMVQHTNDYPFTCPECGKGFKHKAKMDSHMKRHTKSNGIPAIAQSPMSVGLNSEENSMSEIWDNYGTDSVNDSVNDETLNDESEYYTEDTMDDWCEEELRMEEHACDICRQIFINMESLNNHIRLAHNMNEEYKCDQCSSIFLTQAHLLRHEKTHVEKGSHLCEDCGATFRFKVSLHIHMRRHNNDFKRYECNLCNKYFMSKISLKKHVNEHYGLTIYQCDECGEEFDQKSDYKFHILSHSEAEASPKNRPSCTICSKTFCSNSSLRKHMYIHMDVKPYKCDQCNLSFAQKIQLRLHNKKHNGGVLMPLADLPPPDPIPIMRRNELMPKKTIENGSVKEKKASPKKSDKIKKSPKKADKVSPMKDSVSPVKDDVSSERNDVSPVKNSGSPEKNGVSPVKKSDSPVKNSVSPVKEEIVPSKKQKKEIPNKSKKEIKEEIVPERRNAPRRARNALREKREAETKIETKETPKGRRNTPRKARNVIKEEEEEEEEEEEKVEEETLEEKEEEEESESSDDSSEDSDSSSDDSSSESESEITENDIDENESIEDRIEKSKKENEINEKNAKKSEYRYPVCEKCDKTFRKMSALRKHQKYCR